MLCTGFTLCVYVRQLTSYNQYRKFLWFRDRILYFKYQNNIQLFHTSVKNKLIFRLEWLEHGVEHFRYNALRGKFKRCARVCWHVLKITNLLIYLEKFTVHYHFQLLDRRSLSNTFLQTECAKHFVRMEGWQISKRFSKPHSNWCQWCWEIWFHKHLCHCLKGWRRHNP